MIVKYLDKAVVWGLFLILAVAPSQLSVTLSVHHKAIHFSAADPLILVTGLLWGIARLVELSKKFDIRSVMPPYENIAFILLVAISLIKAQDRLDSVKELVQLIEYLIVAFLIFSHGVKERQTIQNLLYTFVSLTTLVVVVGMIQYFDSGRDVFDVKSTFGNRNVLGGYLSVSLPVVLALLLSTNKFCVKLWMATVLTVGMLINLAGGSFLALILAGFVVCLQKSAKATLGWCIFLTLAVALVLPLMPRKNHEVLTESIQFFDKNAEAEPRYSEWQASLSMWKEEPVLGVGIGNYQGQVGMYYDVLPIPAGAKEPDHNNLFLVFLSSTGIIGLLGMLLMLAFWLRKGFTGYWQGKDDLQRTLALAVTGVIVAFFINSFWTALIIRGVFPCLIIVVALLYAFDQLEKTPEEDPAASPSE